MCGEDRRQRSKYVVWDLRCVAGRASLLFTAYENGWKHEVATGNMSTLYTD